MKQPATYAESNLSKSKVELVVLFIVTTVALTVVAQLHWAVALLFAPLVMGALILALMGGVQLLWMLVTGAEKLGTMVGLRKSPLL